VRLEALRLKKLGASHHDARHITASVTGGLQPGSCRLLRARERVEILTHRAGEYIAGAQVVLEPAGLFDSLCRLHSRDKQHHDLRHRYHRQFALYAMSRIDEIA
jgi:hypothetical protein